MLHIIIYILKKYVQRMYNIYIYIYIYNTVSIYILLYNIAHIVDRASSICDVHEN